MLDPMSGSRTTCISARQLNRKYIGIDMSKEYCHMARKRMMKYKNQPSLFMNKEIT